MKIELGKYYNGSDGNIYYVYGSTGCKSSTDTDSPTDGSFITNFWAYRYFPNFKPPDLIKDGVVVSIYVEYNEGIYENFPFVFDTDGIGTHVNLIDEYVMLIFGR